MTVMWVKLWRLTTGPHTCALLNYRASGAARAARAAPPTRAAPRGAIRPCAPVGGCPPASATPAAQPAAARRTAGAQGQGAGAAAHPHRARLSRARGSHLGTRAPLHIQFNQTNFCEFKLIRNGNTPRVREI